MDASPFPSPPISESDPLSFWGEVTSTRDWCEPNYAVTPYIAEFYNTISNVLYIICSINLYRNKRQFQQKLSSFKSVDIIMYSMFFLGVTSAAFHCTLKFWPQAMDRVFCIIPMIGIHEGFKEFDASSKVIYRSALMVIAHCIWCIVALFTVFELYLGYLAAKNIYSGYLISTQTKIKEIKHHCIRCFVYVTTAFILWLLDTFTCSYFLNRYGAIPHFHAMWHILTAMAFHEMGLIQMHLFLSKMKESPMFITYYKLTIGVGVERDFKQYPVGMTEAFIKKATHILNEATRKDMLNEYGIAHKMYCNGLEYFETAIRYETNPMIRQQMITVVREYELRIDHLTRCLHDKWNNIVPLEQWKNECMDDKQVMTSPSMSVAQCINQDCFSNESQSDISSSDKSTNDERDFDPNIVKGSFSCSCFGFF